MAASHMASITAHSSSSCGSKRKIVAEFFPEGGGARTDASVVGRETGAGASSTAVAVLVTVATVIEGSTRACR